MCPEKMNEAEIREMVNCRNEARAILRIPPIDVEVEVARLKAVMEDMEMAEGFEDFYLNSPDRHRIEKEMRDAVRKKYDDPDWTPGKAIGQDGWFFIRLREAVWNHYRLLKQEKIEL